MIERMIKNDLTLKRWRRFKKLKRAVISAWVLVFLLFLSLTAEFWANSKPIIMSYKGSIYFPVVRTYHPTIFEQTDIFVTNYRRLEFKDGDWAVWPLVKWDPLESNKEVATYPGSPSLVNWFGTDDRGRDVLSRLIYGFRYSIGFAVLAWFFSYFLGVIVGSIMGFVGGRTDLVGQRVVEVFESMPIFILLITLVSIFGAGLWTLVIFSSIFGWMMISLYIRGEFLKLRKREFVEAARALGVSRMQVIFKHVLPNALSPIVTFSPFSIAGYIYSLAALDYLGFGLPPPTPSWGELLQQANNYFTIAWWLAVYPSVAMVLTLTVLNLIGEGVRDAFDPRKL
ncbi:MAG: ABC transporter permease subunit [Bdellovibrionaceae bacterium]|nr:ABC transporter permease subunit [Bdellovibrionales bacterium]MCB9086334.1 ABC transporter permease subunit [Pseudobdellovibrionaceae bacterium]